MRASEEVMPSPVHHGPHSHSTQQRLQCVYALPLSNPLVWVNGHHPQHSCVFILFASPANETGALGLQTLCPYHSYLFTMRLVAMTFTIRRVQTRLKD